MLLYLVRHAEANSEIADPSQSLSEKGQRDAKKVASYLAGLKAPIDIIFHSQKLRAKQTAVVFGEFVKPPEGVQETEYLGPLDDPAEWGKILKDSDKNIMLVGHLPYMARLFSLLICGFIEDGPVTFKNVSVVCLRKESDGTWKLQWMIGPDVLQ